MDRDTKTPSSKRDVPMGRVLAHHLREWHKAPYAKGTEFVFASTRRNGRIPICASVFCRVHLRPAAKKAGKENPKTVQGILGHSRVQTTLELYTDEDRDEMIAAQEKYLDAVGFEAGSIQ